jgi:hypothetical protein
MTKRMEGVTQRAVRRTVALARCDQHKPELDGSTSLTAEMAHRPKARAIAMSIAMARPRA